MPIYTIKFQGSKNLSNTHKPPSFFILKRKKFLAHIEKNFLPKNHLSFQIKTSSEFEQVFFLTLQESNFIKIAQVAKSATGKMYKRDTFEHLALHSGVVSGEIWREIDYRFCKCERNL